MGLWYGANWTFVLWGVFRAVVISGYRLIDRLSAGLPQLMRTLGGRAATISLMMLAWIPFRSTSLESSFAMWSKVIQPAAYRGLGMHENVYLVAAVVTSGFFLTYLIHQKFLPYLQKREKVQIIVAETFMFSVMIPLVVVFLRPISQFIYFQF
jgi:alginate O-acetyltransferase complex protein AlgI